MDGKEQHGLYADGAMRYPAPQGPHRAGAKRVMRGGSWNNDADNDRAVNRNNAAPGSRNDNVGFRLLSPGPWPEEAVHGRPLRAPAPIQAGALVYRRAVCINTQRVLLRSKTSWPWARSQATPQRNGR